MRAVANDAQSSLIALLLARELATLLSGHVLKSFYVGTEGFKKGAWRDLSREIVSVRTEEI